jgi:hypothetical protein
MVMANGNGRNDGERFLARDSERIITWYWLSAFTLAALGVTFLLCSLATTSSDAYIGYLLGSLLLLTAGAIYLRKLHRE